MKFSEMPYKRPDAEAVKAKMKAMTEQLKNAANYEEARTVFLKKEEREKEVSTMGVLAYVRHSIDTRDEFYDGEIDFWNEIGPELEEYEQMWIDAMLASPFRKDFEREFGDLLFVNLLTGDHPRAAEGERARHRIRQAARLSADPVRRRRLYALPDGTVPDRRRRRAPPCCVEGQGTMVQGQPGTSGRHL